MHSKATKPSIEATPIQQIVGPYDVCLKVFSFTTLDVDKRRRRTDSSRRHLHDRVVNDKVKYFKYRQQASAE